MDRIKSHAIGAAAGLHSANDRLGPKYGVQRRKVLLRKRFLSHSTVNKAPQHRTEFAQSGAGCLGRHDPIRQCSPRQEGPNPPRIVKAVLSPAPAEVVVPVAVEQIEPRFIHDCNYLDSP